jgi:hypothetical protein
VVTKTERVHWVTLVYRLPREPSSPRVAIWRKLRALGVAQLTDGVVALPEDARTREHLEWVADRVIEAHGSALLLRAQTLSAKDERAMAQALADDRAREYRELSSHAIAALESTEGRTAVLKRLRRDLRNIQRRDYFPPPERKAAVDAVNKLVDVERASDRQAVLS